jgi:PTS system beta-glucosides-specific IIC component
VTLRFKKPFICGCIGGAMGAVVASLFGSLYYAYAALPGLFTLVNAISPNAPMSFVGELVGAGTCIVLTIVMVQFVGTKIRQTKRRRNRQHLSKRKRRQIRGQCSEDA